MIFAVDPGQTESGWVLFNKQRVVNSGYWFNDRVLAFIKTGDFDVLALETITSYGMPVGREIFDTCIWIGRFIQYCNDCHNKIEVKLVPRRDVKTWLCGTPTAKDSNVRAALLEIFPGTGGGAVPQVGTRGEPGPLYGVSGDIWQALALAVMVEKMK